MATSGSFLTSDSGQGGGNFYGRMIFEWWRYGAGISGNVGYHNIAYHLKTYGGNASYWQNFYNGSMNVDGAGYSWGTTKAYGNGATVFGDYYKTLYTDSAGNRSFYASAQGGIFNNTINTSGSGSWALDNIPLYGGITAVSPNTGLTDETASIVVNWYKNVGIARLWFRLDNINAGDSTYQIIAPSNPYSWTGFQNWLQTSMVNTNSTNLYIYYGDDLNSDGVVDHWNNPLIYPITIKNDLGQANPTFTDFEYEDTNAATIAITGNDQVLIQSKSTLEVTVPVADRATPNKNANMSTYTFTIGSYFQDSPWSNSSDVVRAIGAVTSVSGIQDLSVRANDSRGNYKTVTKNVTILPYSNPAFLQALTVAYSNNYDTSDGLTVTGNGNVIANVSPLTMGGTDKNAVDSTEGVKFDVSKGNNSSYTGSPVDVTTSQASGTGAISTDLNTLAGAILTKINSIGADNTTRWYIKFQITDSLETQYYETYIDVGRSIFRIGHDSKVYYNEIPLYVPFVTSEASTSNITPDIDIAQQHNVTALAENTTINAPSGTTYDGQKLIIRIKDNGTARTITWDSIYRGINIGLPDATILGKVLYIFIVYNAQDTKWDVLAVGQET